jgi:hypothetical protein
MSHEAVDRLRAIHAQGPVKAEHHHPLAGAVGGIGRFNRGLAVAITAGVGTMWCAYAFTALSLLGNPVWSPPWLVQAVQWVSQNFLQLVLLSILMVGQAVLSLAGDAQRVRDHEILGHTIDILAHQNRELALQTLLLRALAAAFPQVRRLLPPDLTLPETPDAAAPGG